MKPSGTPGPAALGVPAAQARSIPSWGIGVLSQMTRLASSLVSLLVDGAFSPQEVARVSALARHAA